MHRQRLEPTVLLVDDDDVAIEGVQRSLRRNAVPCQTIAAADGLEALQILRGEHDLKLGESPTLVLLDLNMPRMDGFDFLATLRADEQLRPTVVFVLTTSAREQDLHRAYQQNVAGYMVKTMVGPQFVLLAEFLTTYLRSQTLH